MSAPIFPGIGRGSAVAQSWDRALDAGLACGAIRPTSASVGSAPPPRTASAQAWDTAFRAAVPQSRDSVAASIGLASIGRESSRLHAPAPPKRGGA